MKMNKHWTAAADAHGGKHRKIVEAMYAELGKHLTPEARLNAVLDMSCANLQALKGAPMEEVEEAFMHTASNLPHIKATIVHGVGHEPE